MREDVFKQYYKTMVSIINYKEKDENGNERKCTVPVSEAKKNPDRYRIFTCKFPALQTKQFAYDTELVKKQADRLRELCRILPQEKMGLSYDIWIKQLISEKSEHKAKDVILGETFFAMCEECDIMRSYGPAAQNMPTAIRRNTKRTYPIDLSRKFKF